MQRSWQLVAQMCHQTVSPFLLHWIKWRDDFCDLLGLLYTKISCATWLWDLFSWDLDVIDLTMNFHCGIPNFFHDHWTIIEHVKNQSHDKYTCLLEGFYQQYHSLYVTSACPMFCQLGLEKEPILYFQEKKRNSQQHHIYRDRESEIERELSP